MKVRFLKIALIATIFLFIISLFFILNTYHSQLSGRQNFLRLFYPFLMRTGKWFGVRYTNVVNRAGIAPVNSVYGITITLNNGEQLPLEKLRGKQIMIVNTASDCGYTNQYESLQTLSEEFADNLIIIGFPANDFKQQEKGSDESIAEFCKRNYGVSFPLAKKSSVIRGEDQHPLYRWLTDRSLNGWCEQEPEWNFCKYIINREGVLTHYFSSSVSPLDEKVKEAIGR